MQVAGQPGVFSADEWEIGSSHGFAWQSENVDGSVHGVDVVAQIAIWIAAVRCDEVARRFKCRRLFEQARHGRWREAEGRWNGRRRKEGEHARRGIATLN